jgi:shikimate dehydrogenase
MGDQRMKAALLGFPVGHSVSPAMHHAAAKSLGLDLRYEPWQLTSEELGDALRTLHDDAWIGANVTLPHKPAVAGLVDQLTPLASRIGAVNTIFKRGGELWGENTDAPALMRCLREFVGGELTGQRVLVLGAGGAARAVVVALAELGVTDLAIANRTEARAAELLGNLAERGAIPAGIGRVLPWWSLKESIGFASLLVNATSAGLDGATLPVADLALSPETLIYDLVYGLDETPLVRHARQAGFRAVDGLWMLVYQAALAFELWMGVRPPTDIMHATALSALRSRPK